jgi:hypothetical protein
MKNKQENIISDLEEVFYWIAGFNSKDLIIKKIKFETMQEWSWQITGINNVEFVHRSGCFFNIRF